MDVSFNLKRIYKILHSYYDETLSLLAGMLMSTSRQTGSATVLVMQVSWKGVDTGKSKTISKGSYKRDSKS